MRTALAMLALSLAALHAVGAAAFGDPWSGGSGGWSTDVAVSQTVPPVAPAPPVVDPGGSVAAGTGLTGGTGSGSVPYAFDEYCPPAYSESGAFWGESLAWRKGQYSLVPYGIGWFNMAYDTSRATTGPFVLFIDSADDEGEASFSVDARSTRFGLDVTGPRMLGAETAGRVEFDFQGRAISENRASVLLRQAYGEFRTDEWRLLGGQTDDVIAPLLPNTLNYAFGRAGGNIGYRRAQVRVERYLHPNPDTQVTLQGSLNQTIVTEFITDPQLDGENAGWPTVMGRVAWTRPGSSEAERVELGLSGHIGEEGVDFDTVPLEDDARFLSWSFNADAYIAITDYFGFQGEFFMGDVLGTFLGGINQNIDLTRRDGIRSIGGWMEVFLWLTEDLHTHGGYGIDDPYDNDLSFGRRSQNQFVFWNVIWDITPMTNVGIELSRWDTNWVGKAAGEDFRIETRFQYRF